eukprot:SAG31_NODE_30886_length_375_cov_0.557971_1_plen_36_part_10
MAMTKPVVPTTRPYLVHSSTSYRTMSPVGSLSPGGI